MKIVDKILQKLIHCIEDNAFEQLETERVELKSLAEGNDWTELYKSVCAFLNTEGGIAIIGIKEKDKKYTFSGYEGNAKDEDKLKNLPTLFVDEQGNKVDLSDYFLYETKEFLTGKVCVIHVQKLPETSKYVFYSQENKRFAYKRLLTGDHKVKEDELKAHQERKQELANAYELSLLEEATLDDLDIDKLNEYITLLNRDVKIESLKADVQSAMRFLIAKRFVRNDKPTLLGMLVCGKDVFHFLGGRSEVDGYVDADFEVAKEQKIFKNNIILLMEQTIHFVYKNIHVGVSRKDGGTALPAYPENLLEETINNALAHRNYESDRFIILNIKPNTSIEIRNPGFFRHEHILRFEAPKIRRIVPIAKARNPNLTDVLKTYKRWEGRGIGMAALTNACLNNETDVPYYILRHEEVSLFLREGKVYDDEMEYWLKTFEGYILKQTNGIELSEEEKILLSYFYKSESLNREEKYTILLTADNNHFGVIENLVKTNLLHIHKDSSKNYPIYLVNESLKKTDYINELRAIFGGQFDGLAKKYKDILNVIYQFNHFGLPNGTVTAHGVGTLLYLKENKKIKKIDATKYENYKRQIRSAFNKLETQGFIIRKSGQKPDFQINTNFVRTPSLYDNAS